MGSSVCLYWAGMALNDYADATIDAVERPERPVPSGRVPRSTALAVAGALTAAGLGLATASGGRRSLLAALPLTGVIWAYDLKLKSTPAGAAAMASARTLDVLAGALAAARPGGTGRALLRGAAPAALVGAHTYTLSALSRHEISGAPARVPASTLAAATTTALATALPAVRTAIVSARAGAAAPSPGRTAGSAAQRHLGSHPTTRSAVTRAAVVGAGALAYLGTYGTAQIRALREPSGENVRRAVGAGILGFLPLQTALTARSGATVAAAALGVAHPLARRLARRVSPT